MYCFPFISVIKSSCFISDPTTKGQGFNSAVLLSEVRNQTIMTILRNCDDYQSFRHNKEHSLSCGTCLCWTVSLVYDILLYIVQNTVLCSRIVLQCALYCIFILIVFIVSKFCLFYCTVKLVILTLDYIRLLELED